ncbi:MAG: hypothetical protein R3F31_19065 [Verrucomicrobiales bacterium]
MSATGSSGDPAEPSPSLLVKAASAGAYNVRGMCGMQNIEVVVEIISLVMDRLPSGTPPPRT